MLFIEYYNQIVFNVFATDHLDMVMVIPMYQRIQNAYNENIHSEYCTQRKTTSYCYSGRIQPHHICH